MARTGLLAPRGSIATMSEFVLLRCMRGDLRPHQRPLCESEHFLRPLLCISGSTAGSPQDDRSFNSVSLP